MLEMMPTEIFKNINQITIESHDFLWPELKVKVKEIKNKITNLGFYCMSFSIKNNGNVLFVNKSLISKYQYFYLKYFKRYLMAIKRFLKRFFR